MTSMKVAIDSAPLTGGHGVRGVGTYTRELTQELEKLKGEDSLIIESVDFRKTDLSKFDIVHYPYFDLFFHTLPIQKSARTVVTIYDVIPLIYPKHYPSGIRGKVNFFLQKYSLKNVDAIITDSETSKKDIARLLGVPAKKVYVVYGAPADYFNKISVDTTVLRNVVVKYSLPKKFVLYVGDINYNKNISNLIKACRIAKLPVVIVGKNAVEVEKFDLNHPEMSHLSEVINELKNKSLVLRLGFVQNEDLAAIYKLATVYCQPSFYEGFGLPVLEAMAGGTPVVASKTQALVEIAGDAAIFVDPKSPADMADKIRQMTQSLSLQLKFKNLGLEHIKRFSWTKTAKLTIDVYKRVLAGG